MKMLTTLGALAALALAGCGSQAEAEKEKDKSATPMADMAGMENAATPAATTYSATGTVKSVAGTTVSIAHGPVEGLGWPAMTMSFEAADPAAIQGIKAGDKVAFTFRQHGSHYVLMAIDTPTE